MANPTIAAERSRDAKTGECSATYAPRVTCPDACPMKSGGGCYGASGNCVLHLRRINAGSAGMTAEACAQAEADGIDRLSGKRPLRIHVVGDCPTNEAAEIVSSAAERYIVRHGQPAWAFTHAWRTVDRVYWQSVSVLASCETPEQVIEANKRGYATALICPEERVAEYTRVLVEAGIRPRLCRHYVDGTPCVECGICLDAKIGECVLLPPHGPVRQLRETLAKVEEAIE